MRGRGRSAASASRWKGVDVLAHLEKSKQAGQPRVMRGGVARLSTGSGDSAVNEDDTLYVWHDADLLPNGAVMISARKATFDERWPYTGRRGWRPTSNKLAEAGFHFTPGSGEDDGCTCIYCGVELGGWERSDDPIHEHQRRRPQCPFFHCILADALDDSSPSTTPDAASRTSDTHKRSLDDTDSFEDDEVPRGPKRAAAGGRRKAQSRVASRQRDAHYHSSGDESGDGDEEDARDDAYVPEHETVEENTAPASEAPAKAAPAALEAHVPSPEAQADSGDVSDAPTTHDHADAAHSSPDADTSKSARVSSASGSVVETPLDEPAAVEAAPEPSPPAPEPAAAASAASEASPEPASSLRAQPTRPARARAASKAKARAPSPPVAGDDSDEEVEQMPDLRVAHPDMPLIDDYLPIPFPHKHTSHEPPQPPNPDKVTVVEWIRAQQTYLLDTMRERVEQRLASIRARNLQERKRLEKKLRSQ